MQSWAATLVGTILSFVLFRMTKNGSKHMTTSALHAIAFGLLFYVIQTALLEGLDSRMEGLESSSPPGLANFLQSATSAVQSHKEKLIQDASSVDVSNVDVSNVDVSNIKQS
jgi:hypothetical protein